MITFQEYFSQLEEKLEDTITAKDKDLLERVFVMGQKYHDGQLRANGDRYFDAHCVPVSLNIASLKMDVPMIAAGLLHDTIEDTDVTNELIEQEFGKDIAFMVEGVSKLSKIKYKGNERHVESLRKFFVATAYDTRVVILKLCDRWHNLETLEFLPPDKQKRIATESILIHAQLASRLGIGKLASALKDLAFPYAMPYEYEKTKLVLSSLLDTQAPTIANIYSEILPLSSGLLGYEPIIDTRIKGLYSSYQKLERKDWNVSAIFDLAALRVITKNVDDCYRILGAIHNKWQPLPGRMKDYIALPKPNGYKGLHTVIMSGTGIMVEIQIRTEEMHLANEYGRSDHHSYKSASTGVSVGSFAWLGRLGQLKSQKLSPDEYMSELKNDFFSTRIFALTPVGDVIDLPIGATVLDFAYAVHSDIGDRAIGAKINGVYRGLDMAIPSEAVVEVTTSSKSKPSKKWLDFVVTAQARQRINQYLRSNEK